MTLTDQEKIDKTLELIKTAMDYLEKLEKGNFEIMEPKDSCKKAEKIDCVLIPTVGISKSGVRLGYGKGYYDRFLSLIDAVKISLTYSKQIVKSIPNDSHDVKIDWIITEDGNVQISQVR